MEIKQIIKRQRRFFDFGKPKEISFRLAALERLEQGILKYQKEIEQALYEDLKKSSMEAYMTEIGMTLSELRYMKKHLLSFAKPKKCRTPLGQFQAKSYEMYEPYGVVLVMSPWNYPFLLSLEPVIGAISAGNCCVIKPSAYAGATSSILAKLIREIYPSHYIAVVEGGREENEALLEQKFDYIFFTGGKTVGKIVMEKAARYLTPVTLELGGKSPCIVEETADIKLAAKRVVFGKFLNSGQTCVAVDYVLVQEAVKEKFLHYCVYYTKKMYGKRPLEKKQYGRLVNRKHYERVLGLIPKEKIVLGGTGNPDTLQLEPTILENITMSDSVMQEEIFGPILPVLTFREIEEAVDLVRSNPKPLALYLFTRNEWLKGWVLRELSFGGGCINDTIIHLATSVMGFGGVGESGMGRYHGRYSFETFSHVKSIVEKANWIDLPIRYKPYNKCKEWLLKLFLR